MKYWMMACLLLAGSYAAHAETRAPEDGMKVSLTFSGGHDTDPRDHGRPVVLVAAALNVPPDKFREAFSHVKPAGPGRSPTEAEARANKQQLMKYLGPLGVTDERLNEVSNFYRYRRDRGELWKNASAEGYAIVKNGVVASITITNAGYGYSSPPQVTVEGLGDAKLTAILSFGTDLQANGSIKEIQINKPSADK